MQGHAGFRRRLAAAFALVLCAGLWMPHAAAAAAGDERELQVEAAFLVNFVRYTDWPPGRLGPPGSPYIVSVVGSSPDVATIAAVAAAAGNIDGRRIIVRRVDPNTLRGRPTDPGSLAGAHVVFVQDDSRISCRTVRRLLDGTPVLTVGDAPDFAADGGMLGLVPVESHLAFEANPGAIRASGLAVSAKVLKLARIRETAQ